MRKWIIGLALAGILGFVGVALFMGPRPRGQAALLAGEDAVAFVNIPDIPRTGFRWSQCAWARIVAEPSMRGFLAEPQRMLASNADATGWKDKLAALLPGNVFLAVYPSAGDNPPPWVAGVQFWGKRADWDSLVQWLLPNDGAAEEEHRGIAIQSGIWRGLRIHHAAAGRWGFASPDPQRLRDAIDRATGEPSSPPLRGTALFKAVHGYLDPEADLTAFLALGEFWETLFQIGDLLGASPNPSHAAAVRRVPAVGASWKIKGGDFQELLVALAPESKTSASPALPREMATGPETIAFLQATCPPFLWEGLALATGGEQSGLATLCAEALEPTFSTSLSAGAPHPSLTMTFPVKKPDSAVALAEALTPMLGSLPPDGGWDCGVGNGVFRISNDDGKFLQGPSPLKNSPSVERARLGNPEILLAIDSAQSLKVLAPFVEPTLKSARLATGPLEFDFSRFPSLDVVAAHLSPVVLAGRRHVDAFTLESTGPATPLLAAGIAWALEEAQSRRAANGEN
jgi:hypothetical protein